MSKLLPKMSSKITSSVCFLLVTGCLILIVSTEKVQSDVDVSNEDYFDQIFEESNDGKVSTKPLSLCECGKANGDRIVGGGETIPHRYPWIALLKISINGGQFQCGGILISNRHVVTAAHCTLGASSVTVELGHHRISAPGGEVQRLRSSSVINHPRYDRRNNDYDISVITVADKVNFTSTVQPVCIPQGQDLNANYTDQIAVAVGWGTTTEGGRASDVLMEGSVKVWSEAKCREVYDAQTSVTITPRMICAGGGETDSCQGDSGGPLVILKGSRYVVIGIVSFGVGCGRPSLPGVYSRMDQLMGFVNSFVNPASCR